MQDKHVVLHCLNRLFVFLEGVLVVSQDRILSGYFELG